MNESPLSSSMDSILRRPRGLVLINGKPFDFIDWQVENSSYYQSDTFEVTLPLGDTPENVLANFNFWAGVTGKVRVELPAGFPSNPNSYAKGDLTSFIVGDTDEINIDPLEGRVTIYGRDLSAALLDTKRAEKIQNQTASQIAQTIAARHGLQASVTETTQLVGVYYKADHVNLSSDRTEWDLLSDLAQLEGFKVFVSGSTLHFEQPVTDDIFEIQLRPPGVPGGTFWASNAERISVSRQMTLARDVQVTVRSWNQKSKATFTKRAFRAAPVEPDAARQPALNYFFTRTNLTAEQAQNLAIEKLNEICRHEIVISAELPADTKLSTRSKLRITGTGTPLDQGYYGYSVRRTLSMQDGFACSLEARNQSAENMPVDTDFEAA